MVFAEVWSKDPDERVGVPLAMIVVGRQSSGMTNEIVVGVDGSEESRLALRWGADEAMLRRTAVIAFNSWPFPNLGDRRFGEPMLPDPYETEGHAQRLVEDFVSGERVRIPGLMISVQTREGHPVQSLTELSATASLLVVGARGSGGFLHTVLGSVSSALLLHSHCPLVIVRAPEEGDQIEPPAGRPPTIVVGVDGSAAANAALDWAISEARFRGARLRVVAVWTYPWVYAGPEGSIPPMAFQDQGPDMEAMLKGLLEDRSDALSDVEVTVVVHEGASAPILLDEAKSADLLVVGSRGRGGFKGLLLGSVSRNCAYHAPCPVVIIRSDDEAE